MSLIDIYTGRASDVETLCGYLNSITKILQMLILQVLWQTPARGRAAPLNPVFTDVLEMFSSAVPLLQNAASAQADGSLRSGRADNGRDSLKTQR